MSVGLQADSIPSDTIGQLNRRFIANPSLDLSIGPVFGMHPNLRNAYPKGYYFIEGKGSATVAGLPFKLTFRKSDEDLRFGRASYFKLSFDAAAYSRQQLSGLTKALNGLDQEIDNKAKILYELESRLSYLYQKKAEYGDQLKLGQSLDLQKLPADSLHPDVNYQLPDSLHLSSVKMPNSSLGIPEGNIPSNTDSINTQLDALHLKLDEAQQILDALKHKQLDLKADYSKAMAKKPVNFMSGVKKMDFGLTSLGKSSMSRNAMPIQGIHVQYAGEKYFTDAAAGYTLPNQLFSNQAFDQILYNSGNIFNLGDYFQVNSMRFVSSAKIGYGKEAGNHVAIENYYAGSPLKKQTGQSTEKGLTSNLTMRYTPAKWKNLTWSNTIGVTWTSVADSSNPAPVKTADRIALYSSVLVNFPKLKSSLESAYRRIPSAYDGWTQAIYLRQTERIDVSYKQVLTKRLRTSFRVSRDNFFLQNALKSSRLINQASIDLQLKLTSHLVLSGNYTLLQLQERAVVKSPRSDVSHLARIAAVSTHLIRKNEFTTIHDASYARINGFDSVQTLLQANARYAYQLKKWRFGLQVQLSDFSGLTRLYGRNVVVQPEVGIRLKDFHFSASFQQLWSDQFGRDYGMQFKTGFAFSERIDFDLMMQRFLPTEYALFINQSVEYQKPFYLKFSLNIHL